MLAVAVLGNRHICRRANTTRCCLQALMHLASDAVRAAGESPFLDGTLGSASGVLCAINLPPINQLFDTGVGTTAVLQGMQVGVRKQVIFVLLVRPFARGQLCTAACPSSSAHPRTRHVLCLQTVDGERRAVHLAAQAAAGALSTMSGPLCQDFVLCAEPRPMAEALGDGTAVEVEVTLLVLRLPDGQRGAAGSMPRPSVQQQRFGVGPSVPLPLRQQKPQPQRLPASSWNMLSAMAGGASSSASKAAMSTPAEPADLPAASAGAASAGRQPAMHPASLQQQPRDIPNFFGGSRRQQQQQQKPAEAPPQQQAPARAAGSAVHQHAPLQEPGIGVQVAQPPGVSSQQQQSQEQHKRMTVGDYLVNSLTAQSLDLPPAVSSQFVSGFLATGMLQQSPG